MQFGKIRRATGETAAVLVEAGRVLTLDLYRRPDEWTPHPSSVSHPRVILGDEMDESQTSTTMIRFQPPLPRRDRGPGRSRAGSRGR